MCLTLTSRIAGFFQNLIGFLDTHLGYLLTRDNCERDAMTKVNTALIAGRICC